MKGPHSVYGIYADSKNNIFFMDFGGENVGKIEALREADAFPTPTPRSRPPGRMDDRTASGCRVARRKDRMFDTKTEKFREWNVPRPIPRLTTSFSTRPASVDRGHEHRPRAAHGLETASSPNTAAEPDQHPARVRGQLGHAATFWVGNNTTRLS